MQTDREGQLRSHLEAQLTTEWTRLVRLCARLSGNADVAEDLAQETVTEAWRHAQELRNADALRPWLSGIARNVCLRWWRGQVRDAATLDRFAQTNHEQAASSPAPTSRHELALEQNDLVALLDRALRLLPATTRDVLVQHYINERPHGEIAARLGVSDGAVAVRIHRGKLALRQALARPELSADAVAYGLVDPDDVGWQETHIWCPFCGRHRLAVRINQKAGVISSRCTGPCFREGTIIGGKWMTAGTSALTSVKSILRRELIDLHECYRKILAARGGRCESCGHPAALDYWSADVPSSPATPYAHGILLTCRTCGDENSASLSHLLLDMPQVQQFWRRHPRMQVLPVREIEVHGQAALVSGFASIDASARIEIVSAADTYEILHVDGAVER
ncbi:MAG TPA: sigma-70 family RNA polymerase sigma factor [Thermomicrobiales bacterium]|nr:sigma-70 family RNA polymerase sigma factor [Thermomicrobiales bacterium]